MSIDPINNIAADELRAAAKAKLKAELECDAQKLEMFDELLINLVVAKAYLELFELKTPALKETLSDFKATLDGLINRAQALK